MLYLNTNKIHIIWTFKKKKKKQTFLWIQNKTKSCNQDLMQSNKASILFQYKKTYIIPSI